MFEYISIYINGIIIFIETLVADGSVAVVCLTNWRVTLNEKQKNAGIGKIAEEEQGEI